MDGAHELPLRELAVRIALEMANQLYAFLLPEAWARAAEDQWNDQPSVQPHLLNPALQQLLHQGRLVVDHHVTRGGRDITTFRRAAVSNRERRTTDTAARKRLLYARYLSWASGSASEPGLIGPAGERMLHLTLRAVSSEIGYRLENPDRGNTGRVLGTEVPSGPLDNAFHLYLEEHGRRYSGVIEVKSRREWLYVDSDDLYQVLFKAAALQRLLPKASIVPILVCRRASVTAFRMMKDLGGYIIETQVQWLPTDHSRVDHAELLAVRNELHFTDLSQAPTDGILPYLRRHLAKHLPKVLPRQAERWGAAGCRFEDDYYALWKGQTRVHLAKIRDQIEHESWYDGGW